jgi:transposase
MLQRLTMKRLELTDEERRTLREMGIFHPHPRTRMRAQGILRLSQGLTLQQTADEFTVHLNSVEQWRQRWNKLGLAGLYEGRHTGRPRKWTVQQKNALAELAAAEGGTVVALLRHIEQRQRHASISESTAVRYLKEMNFTFKRYRYSLKKTEPRGVRPRRQGDWEAGPTRS